MTVRHAMAIVARHPTQACLAAIPNSLYCSVSASVGSELSQVHLAGPPKIVLPKSSRKVLPRASDASEARAAAPASTPSAAAVTVPVKQVCIS